MNAAYDAGRIALMLNELRLPMIGQLWPGFAERSDKESWQASRLLGALLEHELAERAKRRIERHHAESHLDPTKTHRRKAHAAECGSAKVSNSRMVRNSRRRHHL